MSYAEAPEKTLFRYATDTNWLNNPVKVLARDLRSSGNESNREWDSFYYEDRNGILFDPVRNMPIVGTDGGDIAQELVNQDLQKWFSENDSGIAIRISPRGGDWNYPDNQLEIYRISYKFGSKQKVVLCAFHQFDSQLDSPEEMRTQLLTKEDAEESVFEIIDWAKSISDSDIKYQANNSLEKEEEAYRHASSLKTGTEPTVVFSQMKQTQFLGENPIGCPPLSLSVNALMGKNVNIIDAKYVRNCGKCGKPLNKFISKGYKCECGGVYEGC